MLKKVKHKLLELLAYHWDKRFNKARYKTLVMIDKALASSKVQKKAGLKAFWTKRHEEHISRREDV